MTDRQLQQQQVTMLPQQQGGGPAADAVSSGPVVLLSQLAAGANHFSDASLLGHGSTGAVFLSVLPDGRQVAVKQLLPAGTLLAAVGAAPHETPQLSFEVSEAQAPPIRCPGWMRAD